MKSIKLLLAVSILALNAVACGDDSSSNSNTGGGDMAAFVKQCKTFCQDQVDMSCSTFGIEMCNGVCDAYGASTGDCATKLKALGTCQDAAVDVCSTSTCATEQSAVQTACAAKS